MKLTKEIEKQLCQGWETNPNNPEGLMREGKEFTLYLFPYCDDWYLSAYDSSGHNVLVFPISTEDEYCDCTGELE